MTLTHRQAALQDSMGAWPRMEGVAAEQIVTARPTPAQHPHRLPLSPMATP